MPVVISAVREESSQSDQSGQRALHRATPAGWWSYPPHALLAILAGLAAFVVYWSTLAPSIVWGDSPELTTAAFCAGVAHPTGYPLYTMLAHAFLSAFPWGSIAHRMNLLAALSGAVAVALIYFFLARITRSRCASLAGALLFAFSRTFWSQAVIAEHYPFEMLGIAAVLASMLAWDRRGDRRWLWASAVVYGLCLTHHMMSLLLAPGLFYFALTFRHRGLFLSELRRTLPLFLLPLTLYLYLPLAALRDPPANWGDPRTWDRFVAHVTGSQYHCVMFHLTRAQLAAQVNLYLHSLPAQFSPAFLWLALLGAWSLARSRCRLLGLTLLIYLADVTYALNYYIYNVEIYYLPSHLMVALWIACGLRYAAAWLGLRWRRMALPPIRRRAVREVCSAALVILPVTSLAANWRENDRHKDWSALVYARAALAALKPHAVVLAEGDGSYFPLLYSHYVEHQRPDVILLELADVMIPSHRRLVTRHRAEGLKVIVPPSAQSEAGGAGLDDDRLLKGLIADNVHRRPTYLRCPADELQRTWLAAAISPYYRVVDTNTGCIQLTPRPPALAIADPQPDRCPHVLFGPLQSTGDHSSDLELLGYNIDRLQRDREPLLKISYYWRLHNPAAAQLTDIWVLFTDADGNYLRREDGTPEFHNIHPLAYGLGPQGLRLPRLLQETYTLCIPPDQCNRPLRIRLAVALRGRFLPIRGTQSVWIGIGSVPPIAPRGGVRRLASATLPR